MRSWSVLLGCLAVAMAAGKELPMGDRMMYNQGFFEGDIAGYDPLKNRYSILEEELIWPDNTIYYEFDTIGEVLRPNIEAAVEEYQKKTCLKFIERTGDLKNTVKDYVKITRWQGCWAIMGRVGGEQLLSLGSGCDYKGLALHELGHSIGMFHEHSRFDRDQYITIIWENINEWDLDAFQIAEAWEYNTLGEAFDYESVMLYGETAFSKDWVSKTILPKQEGITIRDVYEKTELSASDVRRVNKLYECNGEKRPPPPEVPDSLYSCDFEKDDCGFTSQENMKHWKRENVNLGGHQGSAIVLHGEGQHDYGRLISPYYKPYGRKDTCLQFSYFIEGDGAESMTVTVQNEETFQALEFKDKTSSWQHVSLDVKPNGRETRFFFTGTVLSGKTGIMAIDDVKFLHRAC